MGEKPILFSGEMVKAILDGRKTMTRRVVKPAPTDYGMKYAGNYRWVWTLGEKASPYGKPGDTLWVRETWCPLNRDYDPAPRNMSMPLGGENVIVSYRADHVDPRGDAMPLEWRPSIFMPRWASRITLRITNVRAERLQDITNDDAIAEGMVYGCDSRDWFSELWNEINDKRGYGWDVNPWVWVVEFERV